VAATDKLTGMLPHSDGWIVNINLIRPENYVFKGAIIGHNSR
jgi:hypothetical protein